MGLHCLLSFEKVICTVPLIEANMVYMFLNFDNVRQFCTELNTRLFFRLIILVVLTKLKPVLITIIN